MKINKLAAGLALVAATTLAAGCASQAPMAPMTPAANQSAHNCAAHTCKGMASCKGAGSCGGKAPVHRASTHSCSGK